MPPRKSSVKPASYASLLLILFVLVMAQVAGEAILGMRHSGELGSGTSCCFSRAAWRCSG